MNENNNIDESQQTNATNDSTNNNSVTTETKPKKGNKAWLWILILVIVIGLIGGVTYFILNNDKKKDNKKDEKEVAEEKVDLSAYKNKTKDIKRSGKVIPIYEIITNENDNNDIDTNYGEVSLYSSKYGSSSYYDVVPADDLKSNKVGQITCISNDCYIFERKDSFIYQKYAIVIDNQKYYLYDYLNDKLVLGPIGEADEENEIIDVIGYSSNLSNGEFYGLVYTGVNNRIAVYDLKEDLYYENLQDLLPNHKFEFSISDNLFVKYGYLSLLNTKDKSVSLFNLRRAEVSGIFKSNDYINNDYIRGLEADNKLYVLNYQNKDDETNITLFDTKGKQLLDKKVFTNIIYNKDKQFVVALDNQFEVYDKNFKLIKTSKKYTEMKMIGEDFAVALDGTKLQLLDLNDKLLATFITDYNENRYQFNDDLSGWYTENGKNGIYLVVTDNKATPEEILKYNKNLTRDDVVNEAGDGLGYEYYYVPKTKETGKIGTVIGGYAKPVLYLYPKKETKVVVNFEHEDMLTTTYPKFHNNWTVTAKPNGDLKDSNGRYYYGLYWEENGNHQVDFKEGFYVEAKDAITFLEDKLSKIGFNERESNEFIMYWLPILEKNKKNLVYFELTEERDSYNKLLISPKPDSMLRVAIHVKKVDKKVNIKEQQLKTFKRHGFSVVEWGGVEY